jgi:hypothetical protein
MEATIIANEMLDELAEIRGIQAQIAEITHRCPLHCVYCSNPLHLASPRSELTTREWADVFAQSARLGILHVHLSGGEPLARGDLTELANLAHGSLYMAGAYLAIAAARWTGSYVLGVLLGLIATLALGIAVEVIALRTLYERDHLDQVLATFGLILFFNELVAILWGRAALYSALPHWLQGHILLFSGSHYPIYRLLVIGIGFGVGLGLILRIIGFLLRFASVEVLCACLDILSAI